MTGTVEQKSIEEKYKKEKLRDHIEKIPDTYIGSVESTQVEGYVCDEEYKEMTKKQLTYVPGLYKIFDEILVNSLDHCMRLKAEIAAKKSDVKPVKNIHVDIDRETGYIEVMNDGDGIDVIEHPTHKVWIPQLIFGELLTSTNYDPNEEKLWGGKNGYGAKLTNIFSKEFTIETIDHRRKKLYIQRFHDGMRSVDKPEVKSSTKVPYTKIRFLPNYARFGMHKLSDDMYEIFHKRVVDACATTDPSVSIYFNGKKIDIKNFEKYVDLYIGSKETKPRAYESCNDRWEVVATYSDNGQFDQVSFVNGIVTSRGGKHVEYITNQITKRLAEMAASKTKRDIKPQYIKDNLVVFVKALITNPSFDTQTKDAMTTPVAKFGSKCDLSDKFFNALYKTGITEKALSLTDFHENKKLAKTDGKMTKRVLVNKLDDANWAGTKRSAECTLILTEGDSARTMAIAGLSIVGRDKFGVFPLKGKIMNVKDAQASKIQDNEEITNLKKILGLQHGKTYKDASELRYGSIMAMTDSDVDGHHIKGLLFNLFQSMYPSLFKLPGFLTSMLTPIIKVTNEKSGVVIQFYSITDYDKWREAVEKTPDGLRGWKIKYYKGLGTSTEDEAKGYFTEMKRVAYTYDENADEAIDLAFNKKRADDRKKWLMEYDKEVVLDYNKKEISYDQFIHKELIHFSNRDLERSIPSMCDGLKESLRKIMFACFKRNLVKEIKVAQLAAYVSEVSAYHHGEASLQQAITTMAQIFVGQNNANLLVPKGQFGTRIQGGQDAASPRYIFTHLSPMARAMFRTEDADILNYLDDDGLSVEPEYYIPIVPLVLINGALGIGTGFSTNVPQHNPSDVIEICDKIADSMDVHGNVDNEEDLAKVFNTLSQLELPNIKPWYLGFIGTIAAHKDGSYISKGVYRWLDNQTVEITELPIGTWTDDYKEFLIELINNNNKYLRDFESHYTAKTVRFILKLYPDARDNLGNKFENEFKLNSTKNLSLNNIHLYGADGAIKKFKDTTEVIKSWAEVRIRKYLERKHYQIKKMEESYKLISAKVRFIQEIIDGTIIVNNKKISEVISQLKAKKYPMQGQNTDVTSGNVLEDNNENDDNNGGYNYLVRMPIYHLTMEKKKALEKEASDLNMTIKALREKSIQTIWREELADLKKVWLNHKETVEEEYNADRQSRPSGPIKKRAASTTNTSAAATSTSTKKAIAKKTDTEPKKKVVIKKKE